MNEDAATANDVIVLVREIHKNGWLKIPQSCDKKLKNVKLSRKIWVVFCIHDDVDAFLEYYETQQNVYSHKSIESWHLASCLHISPNICLLDDEYSFSVSLDSKILTFSALSREEMMEWIDTMRNKLTELGILGPMLNLYSKEPEAKPRLAANRDPTSPLPPTPGNVVLPPGTSWALGEISQNTLPEQSQPSVNLRQTTESQRNPYLRHSVEDESQIWREFFTEDPNLFVPSSAPPQENAGNVFDFSSLSTSLSNSENEQRENDVYEPLYTPGESSENRGNENTDNNLIRNCRLSLKEKQVEQLKKEMNHPGGIRLRIRRKDCLGTIAFADYLGCVWVIGWKQKSHPLLYHNFHIGDKILSVEGNSINSSQQIHKIIKQVYTPYTEFIVARLPLAKVFAIKRDRDGQDLGLIRENNTAEITEVIPDGLAARAGLPLKSDFGSCNWILTEINGRPLNLFFKGDEIHDRLCAVGKDISILVQPFEFIKVLKKQLKSLRSYKDYIVQ